MLGIYDESLQRIFAFLRFGYVFGGSISSLGVKPKEKRGFPLLLKMGNLYYREPGSAFIGRLVVR